MDAKERKLATRVLETAIRFEDAAVKFRDPKLKKIAKGEDMYNMKPRKKLSGRFNYQLPIVSGFVDTLQAKIDNAPTLNFAGTEEADFRKAAKITAAWRKDATDYRVDLAYHDRGAKKLAIFSGRGILKFYQESDPEYRLNIDIVDAYDFLAEPRGGGKLDRHRFKGQQNLERAKFDLLKGVREGYYDPTGVMKVLSLSNDDGYQDRVAESIELKNNRFSSVGLDPTATRESAEPIYMLSEMCVLFEGEWYHIVYSKEAKAWIRFGKAKKVFGSDLAPWISFATHEDPLNFWSKAPIDDLVPVAEGMTVTFNQALTNRWRQNKGVRAFDEEVFEDPAELKKWLDEGIIPAKLGPGKSIGNSVYEFRTPEINGTIDLFSFLDNFLGQKTGITASSQGVSDKDVKASVYFGDLQQVADRLGLVSKSYGDMWTQGGVRYIHGLREFMPEKVMVRMTGENGVEWDAMRHEDTQTESELDITVTGATAEIEANEMKMRARREAVEKVSKDPLMREKVAPQWLLAETLKSGGFEEEEIRTAMNIDLYGRTDELSRASQAIQEILAGKDPKTYRGATTAYIQKIIDFATDNEVSDADYRKLTIYAEKHFPIAAENAARKIVTQPAAQPKEEPNQMPDPANGGGNPIVPAVGNEMAPQL